MTNLPFVIVARDLEDAGLIWRPEIGDEVAERKRQETVSILVDPSGMTPTELRQTYLWLPTMEQLVIQFEARQAVLFHFGLELEKNAMYYKAVVQSAMGPIESSAQSARMALGLALKSLLVADPNSVH